MRYTQAVILLSACSIYLGNPMDPPDVLGMDPNADRPTKLPNRAKSESPEHRYRRLMLYCIKKSKMIFNVNHFFLVFCSNFNKAFVD